MMAQTYVLVGATPDDKEATIKKKTPSSNLSLRKQLQVVFRSTCLLSGYPYKNAAWLRGGAINSHLVKGSDISDIEAKLGAQHAARSLYVWYLWYRSQSELKPT